MDRSSSLLSIYFLPNIPMILNAHSLDAAKAAAQTDARPVLASLNITATHCVATDSHHLIEVQHPKQEGLDTPVGIRSDSHGGLVPAEAALHASKNIPKGDTLFALKQVYTHTDADGRRMSLTTTDLMQEKTVEAVMSQGNYPTYEEVMPDGEPIARVLLDAKYLKSIAEYFAKHAESRRVMVEFYGENKPLLFRASTELTNQNVRALIMPCRMPTDSQDEK